MGRVINPDSAGKERTRLTKGVVLAARELAKQTDINDTTYDLVAFITLALHAISETIDISVAAWEKRGYWVKADRFRMEWFWAGQFSSRLKGALKDNDWNLIAQLTAETAQKLSKIKVSDNHRLGTPWKGAWKSLNTGS